jgi:agmatine/peptidylarginine deiminase
MCRFISERVLLVNDYAGAGTRSFGQRLYRALRAANLDAELVPFPWFCRRGRCDGVPSAEGCYINFIQLAQGIIVPAFSHLKDNTAFEVLSELTRSPVAPVIATPLAKLGGVFNCVSLTF